MTSTRRRASNDHRVILERLAWIDTASAEVIAGDLSALAHLRSELRDLCWNVEAHLTWEEAEILGAVPEARGGKTDAAPSLCSSHAELRDVLSFCEGSCGCSHPVLLARRACDLVALLREQIRSEEHSAVGSEV